MIVLSQFLVMFVIVFWDCRIGLSYFSKLSVKAQVTYDVYSSILESRDGLTSVSVPGSYARTDVQFSEVNYRSFVTYKDYFGADFDLNVLLGVNVRTNRNKQVRSSTQGA